MARKRATDFEDKQRAILAAAAGVFATMGMEKASMAQVAGQSGISKALLYHYYPSKSALIFDIVLSHLNELDEVTKAVASTDQSPAERLRDLIRQVLETYRGADSEHKLLMYIASYLPPEQVEQVRAIERRIVRRFSDVLKEINPDLTKKRLTPVTMSLFGIMNWTDMWFRQEGPVSRQAYADMVTALILDGIKAVK